MSRRVLAAAAALMAALAAPVAAQDEPALRSFFEGRRVTLKIDMPATSDGVDVRADSNRPIDYERYGNHLKAYGTAIHTGEASTVTLVKVKKDLIEFHLGGGGFGTFGDDTSTSVYMPLVEKSGREKDVERAIKDEDDSRRRRELERDLEELRGRRERENERIEAARALAEERKREVLAERRLKGGSRFNLRYDGSVPRSVRPAEVMASLAAYVDFSTGGVPSRAENAARSTLVPRKGMTRAEAEREFGTPAQSSERREGTVTVIILHFVRENEEISAEFVEDVLIRYATQSR